MKIVLVNPIAATPDVVPSPFASPLASPRVSSLADNPRALREINIVELAGALATRGHEVTVVVAGDYLGGHTVVLPGRLTVDPANTFMRFPFHPGLLPMTPGLMGHPALRDADVIQTGEFHQPSTFFSCKAARESGAGLFVWQESFEPLRAPGSWYQGAYERTAGRVVRETTRGFIPRTTKARDFLSHLGVGQSRITSWIPTGIDTRRFAPKTSRYRPEDFAWATESRVLLIVGRLHPWKGIDLALQAFQRIAREEPMARLIVAGSGAEMEGLQRLAHALGISGLVAFVGKRPRDDLVDLYALAEVVLCTSRRELLPFALIEASACARPCVTFDVGAARDIVVDEETGIVIDPPDSAAFADAVLRILRDDGLRARLAAGARRRIESTFDMALVAQRLIEVYDATRN